jgi:hypothetical protein
LSSNMCCLCSSLSWCLSGNLRVGHSLKGLCSNTSLSM